MTSGDEIISAEEILRQVAEGTAANVGEDFLQSLVLKLASVLRVRYAFVSEFAGSRSRVRTLAFCDGDHLGENLEFDISGTPCEAVLNGQMCLYERGIQGLFPRDKGLVRMHAEGYLAIPLTRKDGRSVGHLAILDDEPMMLDEKELSVFHIFANRARAEIDRLQAEKELRVVQARTSGILASAMDVIITIGRDRRITMFNQSAARVFRCSADWAVGQCFLPGADLPAVEPVPGRGVGAGGGADGQGTQAQ